MSHHDVSRRKLLARGAVLPLAGFAMLTARAAGAAEAACADPTKMDSGQVSIRESLNYVEASKDPTMVCGGCGFFNEPKGNCGGCMIFNGPVNAKGHCDSWAPKG